MPRDTVSLVARQPRARGGSSSPPTMMAEAAAKRLAARRVVLITGAASGIGAAVALRGPTRAVHLGLSFQRFLAYRLGNSPKL